MVFADYGIPGEKVMVEIIRAKGRYPVGKVVEVINPSPHRVSPPCPYFGRCGGCQWQHIDYKYQLELKRQMVEDRLKHIGNFVSPPVSTTLPSPDIWHYRNHARFTVDRQGSLGFVRRDNWKFMSIDFCHIMHPWINESLGKLQGRCPGAHQVAMRYGVKTGKSLIQPNVDSFDAPVESGQPFYYEELLGKEFRISSPSFFQVNTLQAERLVEAIKERLDFQGDEFLVDAYAGVGTLAILLSPFVSKVLAIEESSSAIKDALVNNAGIENIEIKEGKAEQVLPTLTQQPAAVILDPPRTGCHRKVLEALIKLDPKKIIYVSCDTTTLSRDLELLCRAQYHLQEVLPVDMFPHTRHIECVAHLIRRSDMSPSEGGAREVVLASTSPRRKELFSTLGIPFKSVDPLVEEDSPASGTSPEAWAEHLALSKARAVEGTISPSIVVAADTLVLLDDHVLGKPKDAAMAREMLLRLRGKEHIVITGLALLDTLTGRYHSRHVVTKVTMRHYSNEEIEEYIASGAPLDKAGAYGVQDELLKPVARLEDCYTNVVGFPLCALKDMLADMGVEVTARPDEALLSNCLDCPLLR